jgi:methylamine--corrinoid protein Co-methyltransferase
MKYGCVQWGMGTSFIGGMAGGPEGAAITAIAETLACYALYQLDILSPWTPNSLYPPGISSRLCMWSQFLTHAALNKNTNFKLVSHAPYQSYAGPCTEMCFLEIASTTIGSVVVGSNPVHGGGRAGAYTDYCAGLDSRFMGEVAHAATGMKRETANEMIKELLLKYEDRIKTKNPPIGKKFQECYDLKSITPSNDYLNLYRMVWKDLDDKGLILG